MHYDIRAVDDTQVELYMTADGDFSKWLFDGKSWKNVRFYDLRIEGEFMVWDRGDSIVTERDGRWSLIRHIEGNDPPVRPLVDRIEGEPLILVEDTFRPATFFLHRDQVLDEDGREVRRVARGAAQRDRTREAIDFVISRRGD